MHPLHFFVLEDQTLTRELLCEHLKRAYPGCTISTASCLAECELKSREFYKSSIAIIDLELPDGNALDWLEPALNNPAAPKAVLLSSVAEDVILYRALHSNIPGFVHKADPTETLHTAISIVQDGGVYFSKKIQEMRKTMHADPNFYVKLFSPREQEVLVYIGSGMSNSEAAAVLGLRESTVAEHRTNIMRKLGITSQPELLKYALKKGFTRLEPQSR